MPASRFSSLFLFPALRAAAAAVFALGFAACSEKPGSSAAAKREITPEERQAALEANGAAAGKDVRMVWLRRQSDGQQVIAGMDAKDGQGVRDISSGSGSWRKPLLTSDGASVIVTRVTLPADPEAAPAAAIFSIPWAGGAAQPLGAGFALTVHREPADGSDWIYALESLRPARRSTLTGSMLVRFHPAAPAEREIIWADGVIGTDNFQLSRDGKSAAGLFPWPRAGRLDLSDPGRRRWTPIGHGSWTSMAADDSYATCLLDGSRSRLKFIAPNLEPGWDFNLQEQAALKGQAVTSLRWSNDPRMLCFTAGEETGAEVWLAHFTDDLRRVERFVRVTHDTAADSEPDLWVSEGHLRSTVLPPAPVAEPPKELPWPAAQDALLFAWENADKSNFVGRGGIPATCTVTPRANACLGRFASMNVAAGWFEADDASARAVTDSCREKGAFSLGLILTERISKDPISVRLISLQRNDGADLLVLHRVDRWLVLRLLLGADERAAHEYTLDLMRLSIEDQRPAEVMLCLNGDTITVYLDGSKANEVRLPERGFAAWRDARLFFGDAMPYGEPWRGSLERVSIHSRGLDEAEVKESRDSSQLMLEPRRRTLLLAGEAKLIESSTVFPPEKLPQMRSGLTTSVWEITRLNTGPTLPGKRIAVLRWAAMDGKPLPPPALSGDTAELVLEPFDEHDELAREFIHDTTSAENLPVYFDAALPRQSFATYR